MSPTPPELDLVPEPTVGRRFRVVRRVRYGDADPSGRLRLDAIARYLQDVANDDTRDAGLDPAEPWVVRRTTIRTVAPLRNGELVTVTTWSGGHGRRWAERRTSLRGDGGGHVEAASLWVRIDPVSGRPAKLSDRFHEIYDEAAGGREVGSRLVLDGPPPDSVGRPYPLRTVDLDVLGHVNNAATWAPVEDAIAAVGIEPAQADLEYPGAIEAGEQVEMITATVDGDLRIWLTVAGDLRAAARIRPAR